ncbi:MAG: PHP domain-containing protein, partial [Hyphomicrobiaceae bacterium]
MTTQPFIHLRVHSAYSLLEGALPIAGLADLAASDGQPALAITDTNNLFGALEFSEKMSGAGVQPLTGCTLQILVAPEGDGPRPVGDRTPVKAGSLVLIAKDATGYDNLMTLASGAFLGEGRADNPGIGFDDLEGRSGGLIALTGGPDGCLDRLLLNGQKDAAVERLDLLMPLFGDRLYIELQRHGRAEEKQVEPKLIELAYEKNLPLVATNECFFPTREDYEAHDALICIADGRYVSEDDRRKLTPEHYFKSQDEMRALFADIPEAIDNTVEIARRCSFRPQTRDPILPQFVTGSDDSPDAILKAEAAEMRRQSEDGLEERLRVHGCAPGRTEQEYRDRLAFELDVIISMKFPGYFLIVADFIKWAKEQDIPVGPGRGSGAGSVVAWSLTITDLDPLRWGLL